MDMAEWKGIEAVSRSLRAEWASKPLETSHACREMRGGVEKSHSIWISRSRRGPLLRLRYYALGREDRPASGPYSLK
jgi:hypothetical protein